MDYVEKYGINLNFGHTLIAVDGPSRRDTFTRTLLDGSRDTVVEAFDLLHTAPPQTAPDFVRVSPLADAAGWVDVDPTTLRNRKYENVHGLGDATNTSNAETTAAAVLAGHAQWPRVVGAAGTGRLNERR